MNFKIFPVFIGAVFLCHSVIAQDDELKKKASEKNTTKDAKKWGWSKGGFFSSTLSNTTFSNWAAGGTNNTAFLINGNIFAIKKDSNYTWENYLKASYGVIRNGASKIADPLNPSANKNNPFVKNTDELIILTKYGRRISDKLNYSALFNLNTQMFPGWAPEDIFREQLHVSNFLAQGFGYFSIGIDIKPQSYFSIYLSPVTAKYTIVREQRLADMGLYGVEAATYDTLGNKLSDGQKYRIELGWYMNLFFNKDIMKNINLQSRLELFNNYNTLGIIDVNWQTTLNMKVNKYITVSFINQMLYDNDIDVNNNVTDGIQRRLQLRNFFGAGFSYKFGDEL